MPRHKISDDNHEMRSTTRSRSDERRIRVELIEEMDNALEHATPIDEHNAAVNGYFLDKNNPPGRPRVQYKAEMALLVKSLHMLGTRVIDICALMGISTNTYYEFAKNHPSFTKAIFEGRELADAAVAASMYHRATGYTHAEEKIHFDREGNVSRATTLKHYPPDTAAGVYWLNNRQRRSGNWKSSVDVTTTDPDGKQVDPTRPPRITINATPTPQKED